MSKIVRKTAKLFGSTAGTDQIAQFGSLAAGTPSFSIDPATIQSLSQWLSGWFAAATDATNSPAIEDMNAFCYVMAYQICYAMQEGVPEWDSGTTYYQGSFVNSNGQLFISLTDNNTNHAVTDLSNWRPLSGLVNVKDYGAKGDGSTDDTAAIQAALDALGPVGTNNNFVCYIPTGNYVVSNLTIPATVRLLGDGRWQSFLTGKTGSTGYMLTDTGNAVKIIIENLSFQANNCSYTSVIRLGYGSFQWGTEGYIQNIHVRDCPGIAVDLNANVGTCRGISVWNVHTGFNVIGNANFFSDCYIAGFTVYGVNASDSFWTNTELEAPTSSAIPFYMNGIVKVNNLLVSLSASTNIASVFQIDGTHGEDCTVQNLVIYNAGGTGTYTQLVQGSGLSFFVTANAGVTANAIATYADTTGQSLANGLNPSFTGQMAGPAGSNSAPTYTFSGNGNTGMYETSGNLLFSTSGTLAFGLDTSQFATFVGGVSLGSSVQLKTTTVNSNYVIT